MAIDFRTLLVQNVTVTEDTLMVDLVDGRTISAPLAWYPRLLHGQPEERNNWRLIGKGEGIWLEERLRQGKPSYQLETA